MNKHTSSIFLVVLIVVLTAWTTPAFTAEIPQVQPDKGLVVFYRLNQRRAGTLPLNVNHTEESLGQLLRGRFLYRFFDPGNQTFWSQVPSQDSITLEIEAGKAYYVRGDITLRVDTDRVRFTLVPEAEAQEELARLR